VIARKQKGADLVLRINELHHEAVTIAQVILLDVWETAFTVSGARHDADFPIGPSLLLRCASLHLGVLALLRSLP
jgi:hypothetical protein